MPKTRRKPIARSSRRKAIAGKSLQVDKAKNPEAKDPSQSPEIEAEQSELPESARLLISSVGEDSEEMQLAREFRALCSQHAHQANAAAMRQYMRNKFSLFGIKAPQRRALQKEFASEQGEKLARRPFLLRFTLALWQQEERECQLYGVDLMSRFRKEILGETRGDFDEAMACVEVLITRKSWWDTVDLLASQMVGYAVSQRREWGGPLMEEWIAHSHMWLRRTALLHQLHYKAETDEAMLFKFCLSVAHEEELFIRKAIGWALREYAKTDRESVRQFLEKNRETLSKLSIREASKHLQ